MGRARDAFASAEVVTFGQVLSVELATAVDRLNATNEKRRNVETAVEREAEYETGRNGQVMRDDVHRRISCFDVQSRYYGGREEGNGAKSGADGLEERRARSAAQ